MKTIKILPLLLLLSACAPSAKDAQTASKKLTYPAAERTAHTDILHGVEVADPYRWMEEIDSPQTRKWVEEEAALTRSFIDALPDRGRIVKRLGEVWNYARYGVPYKRGGRYFFSKNDGLQNQSVHYWTTDLKAEPKVLIDPNTLSEDGTVSLAQKSISPDGKYTAYGLASAGSDWEVWHVREVESGKDLGEDLRWVKFSGAEWSRDSKGFYYSCYPAPKEGGALKEKNLNQALYYHTVGTPQTEDVLVFSTPEHPKWGFGADVTKDGAYLLITVWKGTDDNVRVYIKDLKKADSKITELIPNFDAAFSLVSNDGEKLYFKTTDSAERGRLISISAKNPAKESWQEVLAQKTETLKGISRVGDYFFAQYLRDAHAVVEIIKTDLSERKEVDIPGLVSVWGFGGDKKDTETYYGVTGYARPQTIYHYDLASGASTVLWQPKLAFNPEDFVTEQHFFPSKDGTKIPMFLTHRRDVDITKVQPTYLYGYGGFNISLSPYFSPRTLVWLEEGGVYAVANLRGGGEYGEAWHKAGTKLNKQNVFDDFIGAAEWLISEGRTTTQSLVIGGASNGGLLVGAVLNQRPDLFGAAMPGVGVMDMLRFHKFTIGWAWMDDYGSPDIAEEFAALYAYSPVHTIKVGAHYPSVLITTADHDDRVFPAHSFKYAAALQHGQGGEAPILIRIEVKAGHGAGKPTSKKIEDAADHLAFMVSTTKKKEKKEKTAKKEN